MHLQPQIGLVFMEPMDNEEVRDSGLVISTKHETPRARIANLHPETARLSELNIGDVVIFNPYSVREVPLNATTKRLVIAVGDVLAKVSEETNDA